MNATDNLIVGMMSSRTMAFRPLEPLERDIMSVYALIYESLVEIDDNYVPSPKLAESWEVADSGKRWTFTLRENLRFSDGTPLTAYDVAASGQYILDMAKNEALADRGFYQNIRYLVDSFSASSEDTLVVKAARPYYGLLYAMTFPVVPGSMVASDNPVGSGPYRLSDTPNAFQPGSVIYLDVNENWWKTSPAIREITVQLYQSGKELISSYEYGRLDTALTRSVSAAQYKSGLTSLSISYRTRQLEALLLNHTAFPLETQRIREAIRCAIDIDAISTSVYMGLTYRANTPVIPGTWMDLQNENDYAFNLDKAAKILEEEGWADTDEDGILDKIVDGGQKNFRLQLYVYEDPENNVRFETANMIADMLLKLKIFVKINTVTYAEAKTRLEAGSFDIALCAYQMDVVPDAGFCLMSSNVKAGNYSRYRNKEMTGLYERLRKCVTIEDFASATMSIQQKFYSDVPFIALFYRAGAILTRKMFTTVRDIREYELLRGVESFGT